jgi:hypothetical protein
VRRLAVVGLVLLLSAGVALAAGEAASFQIPRWIIAGGGGSSAGDNFVLSGTVGQAVVGTGSAEAYDVCSGFWGSPCGHAAQGPLEKVYLPVVIRGGP